MLYKSGVPKSRYTKLRYQFDKQQTRKFLVLFVIKLQQRFWDLKSGSMKVRMGVQVGLNSFHQNPKGYKLVDGGKNRLGQGDSPSCSFCIIGQRHSSIYGTWEFPNGSLSGCWMQRFLGKGCTIVHWYCDIVLSWRLYWKEMLRQVEVGLSVY